MPRCIEVSRQIDGIGQSRRSRLGRLPISAMSSRTTQLFRHSEMTGWAMCGRLRVGKKNLHVAGLVGAAMCSAFECGSHDRWP